MYTTTSSTANIIVEDQSQQAKAGKKLQTTQF